MASWHAKQLILHGGVILLLGFLCGAPLGSATARGKEETARAWRVAHSSLISGGVLLLALAGVIAHLQLSKLALSSLVWAFVGSSYYSLSCFLWQHAMGIEASRRRRLL